MADIKALAEDLLLINKLKDKDFEIGYYGHGRHRKQEPKPTNRLSNDEIRKRKAKAKRRRK